MIYPPLPLPPGAGDHPGVGRRPPVRGSGEADSWLRGRRRGQASSALPLHLVEAFLVSRGGRKPAEGLVRFRISDNVEEHRSWRSRSRHTDAGRQLAGSTGQLRLARYRPVDQSVTSRAPVAILTINGITDVASLARLDVANPFPCDVGTERGRAAPAGLDVHFVARLWDLAFPGRTRCQVHLEGSFRVLPHWPLQ